MVNVSRQFSILKKLEMEGCGQETRPDCSFYLKQMFKWVKCTIR